MDKKYTFIVDDQDANKRIDQYLETKLNQQNQEVSRSFIQNYIEYVTINNTKKKKNYKIKKRDVVEFIFPKLPELQLKPEKVDFDIVYEDSYIIIVNKPAGLVVHPSKGHHSGTLVHGILHKISHFQESEMNERPGIVHRLDKDTSGLMVIAKTQATQRKLMQQFKDRKVKKEYTALVKGKTLLQGKIDEPIARHPIHRKKFKVDSIGKPSLTYYNKIATYEKDHKGNKLKNSLVKINLVTGRTHQIRVHFSSIGHPVIGDVIYSKPKHYFEKEGLALCSNKLALVHPTTEEKLEFSIPLPDHFNKILDQFDCTN